MKIGCAILEQGGPERGISATHFEKVAWPELIQLPRHGFTALGADNLCEITCLGGVQPPAKDDTGWR